MLTLSDKKNLRKIALKKRASLDIDALSSAVVQKILNLDEFIKAKNIALYYPIKNEIDITLLLNIKNKNFYFPSCALDELSFLEYKNKFIKGRYNILEADGRKINPCELDIIFTPALMANRRLFRLGYGKGYYDRFFKNNQLKAKKIGILPFELINDEFCEDSLDMPLDFIISEKEIIC